MLTLYEESFSPTLDTAVSHALLRTAAEGHHLESLRLYRPERVVAFGKRDTVSDGFVEAVVSAETEGYAPVIRMAGGRAAVFHQATIAFAWTVPARVPRDSITERFRHLSGLLVEAFRGLGADARVGEVPGEYCPGEFSINVGGLKKVMGVGQRLIAGAAHVGGVIVVDRGEDVAEVLTPVYRDLDLDWDPQTSGDLTSAIPGVTWHEVRDAVLLAFRQTADVEKSTIPERVMSRARDLEPRHRPPAIRP